MYLETFLNNYFMCMILGYISSYDLCIPIKYTSQLYII